jgi:hypothetical protein
MKWILYVIGVVLILVGIVWTLQGFNLLLGSFMSGQILYAVLGIVLAAVGVGLMVYANRRGRKSY